MWPGRPRPKMALTWMVDGCATSRDERRKEPTSMSNENLVADVNDELRFDPKVDSEAIAVAAEDGVITLRGTVGSLRQKREAKRAAGRIRGVVRVDNQLKVRPMGSDA